MTAMNIPDTLADLYKGCGTALAAVEGGTIVDLVYLRDILPDANDGPESLVRLLGAPGIGRAALKLLKAADQVYAGMISTWEFMPIVEIERHIPVDTVLLDPGNEGEPGTLWTHDVAHSSWKTELRVADNSFNIIIVGGHPQWDDVAAEVEVLIQRDGDAVRLHKSDEKNWTEARRLATVVMRVANAASGA